MDFAKIHSGLRLVPVIDTVDIAATLEWAIRCVNWQVRVSVRHRERVCSVHCDIVSVSIKHQLCTVFICLFWPIFTDTIHMLIPMRYLCTYTPYALTILHLPYIYTSRTRVQYTHMCHIIYISYPYIPYTYVIGRRHRPPGPRLHRAHPLRPHREVLAQGIYVYTCVC